MVLGVTETGSLAETKIHDILRNQRRREVLDHMREAMGTVTLRELAEHIAELESGESPPPSSVRESVYNSLHQTHLPKLNEEGVIDYDRNRKTIALTSRAREVDVYMEVVTPYGMTWADYYRSVGMLALLTVLGVEISVPLLETVPLLLVVSFFLGVVTVSTAYQLWSRRWLFLKNILE